MIGETKRIRPAKGKNVYTPEGVKLTGEKNVVFDTYWRRRLDTGEVEFVKPRKKKEGDK